MSACRWWPLLLTFLLARAEVAPGQAPAPTAASSELPRFTLRQIVTGRNDSVVRIPGPWYRAATEALPESLIAGSYRAAAARSGLRPLEGRDLTAERSQHVMGLFHRPELVGAARRTLEEIRLAIPSDTTRARFDRIFRPGGRWIVDLHDAAMAWAQQRAPRIGWDGVRRALQEAHWLASGDSSAGQESLLRALYGLAVLSASDSAAFAAAEAGLWRADSVSAAAVLALLHGYTDAQRWYADAIGFLLGEPWFPAGAGRSIRDYVRAEWRSAAPSEPDVPLPRIETRWFGYPQAVPQYGVPPALFPHLVAGDNAAASRWLRQNGEPSLLRTLRWLPPGDTTPTVIRTGSETLRLTTVSRQSRESLNGFLEAYDVIAIDPGYSPLLALGAVVHEWQHLLFRRRQLERFAATLGDKTHPVVELPGVQPYLAEGFAEWSAERILAPVTQRWPLLSLGELEKRADLIQRGTDDQHAIGYALVRVLAAAVSNRTTTTDILLRNADDPSPIPSEPALRGAWRRFRGEPARTLRAPRYRLLIPEVTFTIEDGFPDVVATRILVPGDAAKP